jgi:hypothetical protein
MAGSALNTPQFFQGEGFMETPQQKYRRTHREQRNAAARKAHAENPEKSNARSRAYYAANKEKVLERCRNSNYGDGAQEHFEKQFVLQEGRCTICGTLFTSTKYTHQDHNHLTEQLRGVLCNHCNKGLSGFKDSPELLRAAAIYLEEWDGRY